ncbi:MAG: esterase [Alphaproteobacteria bacterium]|nr:esterase [Alphaproteobacteria bacterium]
MPQPFPTLPPARRGTVHRRWVHAPCLRDNPWGDPADRELLVYTPPGYSDPERHFPVVMVLPGFAGTGEGLLARGLQDLPLSTRIDRLIDAGCPPFVAVMPDTMTSVGGSQYLDSPGIGAYQTYLVDVVRPYVDEAFRTTGAWAVAGRSSGGLGAFHLAVRAPEVFRAAALHAADAGFDVCYLGDLVPALTALHQVGAEGFVERFWAEHRPPGTWFAALNVIAMSCAYSPDPGARPFPARLPFDLATGALRPEVLDAWRAHDPVVLATRPEVRASLSTLALLHVDAGDRDEYLLQLGARRLVSALREGGVAVEHEEHPGTHRGTSWRFDVSLPRLVRALGEDGAT